MEEKKQNDKPLNKDFKVPRLRFRKYNDEWIKTTFGEIADYKKGPFGSSLKLEMFIKEGPNTKCVYEQRNVIEHDNEKFRYFLKERDVERLKSFNCKSGDILITCAGTIGEQYILPSESPTGIFNQALMRVRLQTNVDRTIFSVCFDKMISYSKQKYSNGSAIKNIPPLKDLKNRVVYLPKLEEQEYIAKFIELLSKKINLLNLKISTLKKYRKGLIQIGLNQVYSSDYFVRFSDLYIDINERNIDGLNQYTVGKERLKPILESNYDLQKHKIFHPNCLLIGIGIEEIAVSVNGSGSVSPVYNVYRINNKDYLNYTRFFLKPILWRKKAFITRKSTRREYEIDTKELLRFNLPVPVDSQFGKVCKSIEALDILIQQFMNKLKQLNKIKSYLLKNMFI